ncbi:MAG: hypothetical protein RLZZ157_21 [Pseudomonadota bacterium]|jgi:hypothetical protein
MPEIEFKSIEDIQVPAEYVYLCNATRSANVNLIPIYHFGKKKMKAIVIQCGIANSAAISQFEQNEAIKPTKSLAKVAHKKLGLPKESIVEIQSSSARLSGWEAGIEWAKKTFPALPIVANLQGGTKEMALGTLAALNASADTNWMLVFVDKVSGLPRLVARVGNSTQERAIALEEVSEWVPPVEFGMARGFQVTPNRSAPADEKFYDVWANEIWKRMIGAAEQQRNNILLAFNAACSRATKKAFDLPEELPVPRPSTLTISRDAIADLFGVSEAGALDLWNNGQLGNEKSKVRIFLTGGWLERVVAHQVRAHLDGAKIQTIALLPNAKVSIDGVAGISHEIDLLVVDRDTLNLVEVKTSVTTKQASQYGQSLAAKKTALDGNLSHAWLVAPFLWSADQNELPKLEKRLSALGVTLLSGNDAITRLATSIASRR